MTYDPHPRPPYQQPPPPQAFVARPAPSSTLATVSLVLGILGIPLVFCTLGAFSAAAIICGHLALKEIRQRGLRGHAAAVWGLVLGYALVGPGVLVTALGLLGVL